MRTRGYDAVIVGSGYGGAMAAHQLVRAGAQVLMIERGDWVARGAHNRAPDASLELLDWFQAGKAYRPARRPRGGPEHEGVAGSPANRVLPGPR